MNGNGFSMGREKEHKLASRAIFIALIVLLLIFVVALTVAFMLLFFPVTVIEVEGESRYSYSEVIEMSDIGLGDRLYYVDKEGAENRLLSAFPYLKSVRVHTYFPNRVKIEIEEHDEIYLVFHESGFAYLGENFEILEIKDDAPEYDSFSEIFIDTSEHISGEVGERCMSEEMETARELIYHIKKNGFFQYLNIISVKNKYDLYFIAGKKYKFIIGAMSDIDEKLSTSYRVCLSDSFKRNECSEVNSTDRKRVFVRYIGKEDILKEFDFCQR